jgi:hypothetical protein
LSSSALDEERAILLQLGMAYEHDLDDEEHMWERLLDPRRHEEPTVLVRESSVGKSGPVPLTLMMMMMMMKKLL